MQTGLSGSELIRIAILKTNTSIEKGGNNHNNFQPTVAQYGKSEDDRN